jgi:hypothetical protein
MHTSGALAYAIPSVVFASAVRRMAIQQHISLLDGHGAPRLAMTEFLYKIFILLQLMKKSITVFNTCVHRVDLRAGANGGEGLVALLAPKIVNS